MAFQDLAAIASDLVERGLSHADLIACHGCGGASRSQAREQVLGYHVLRDALACGSEM